MATVTKGRTGEEIAEIGLLRDAGAVATLRPGRAGTAADAVLNDPGVRGILLAVVLGIGGILLLIAAVFGFGGIASGAASIGKIAAGFGIAMVAGLIIGFAMGRSRFMSAYFSLPLFVLGNMPGLTYAVFGLLIFGVGAGGPIVVSALVALPFIDFGPVSLTVFAIFYGLDMRGIQLQGAHLEGADLRNCDLSGADLRGAATEARAPEARSTATSEPRAAAMRGRGVTGGPPNGRRTATRRT